MGIIPWKSKERGIGIEIEHAALMIGMIGMELSRKSRSIAKGLNDLIKFIYLEISNCCSLHPSHVI